MSELKTYEGFEDIPVYNFYKIAETSDMRWFYKDFRGDKSIKETQDFVSRYKAVYDARISYTNDVKSQEYYRKLPPVKLITGQWPPALR